MSEKNSTLDHSTLLIGINNLKYDTRDTIALLSQHC